MNQFKIKDTCIKFVINNISPQGNNVKIKLNLKVEKICRDDSDNFLWNTWQGTRILFSFIKSIFITLWDTLWNMKCFIKIVTGWIYSTILAKSSILDVSLSSEYASDYPEAFSFVIIIYWGFRFESFMDFLIWLVFYLSI